MDWTLSDSVAHWLGPWDTKRLGLSNSHGTLPGPQESPTSAGGRILASNEAIIDCPIGSDPRCQYYITNVTEFTIINSCGPGGRSNHRRCRFGTLGWFFSGSWRYIGYGYCVCSSYFSPHSSGKPSRFG